jgi:hypothetical protein
MNNLRSYLMRTTPRTAAFREPGDALDDNIAGCRTDRQRRIFEWHIGNCPECSKYLNQYQQAVALDRSPVTSRRDKSTAGPPQSVHSGQRGIAREDFDLFGSSPLFRGLPLPDLKRIFPQGEILELDRGVTVIEEGKVNSSLYVVLSGEFRVSLPAGPARYGEVELARRKAPDCFGEYAFIDYKLASANVTATQKSRLYKIGFDVLDQFIDSDPRLGSAIYENALLLLVARLRAEGAELDVFRPC